MLIRMGWFHAQDQGMRWLRLLPKQVMLRAIEGGRSGRSKRSGRLLDARPYR
jgi:hypothetical protein